jgi:hypothetical protein
MTVDGVALQALLDAQEILTATMMISDAETSRRYRPFIIRLHDLAEEFQREFIDVEQLESVKAVE